MKTKPNLAKMNKIKMYQLKVKRELAKSGSEYKYLKKSSGKFGYYYIKLWSMQYVTWYRKMKNGMKSRKKLKKIIRDFECRTFRYRMYLLLIYYIRTAATTTLC